MNNHQHINTGANVFSVPGRIIGFSALFMGILASVPKILQLHITIAELFFDAMLAFVYTLLVWYLNIRSLPKYTTRPITNRFFSSRLLVSITIGISIMAIMVLIAQAFFPKYHFGAMVLMYEFRGVLINLTVYMFLHVLYQSHANRLIGIELERTKADHLSAQYELLKQQVNPHFLFNSLNTLKSMVDVSDPNTGNFIIKLADFYRFTLEHRKANLIPVAEELDTLKAYLYLLKARFEEGIHLEIDLLPDHLAGFIPPFTLQLLAENCIKHNVVSLEHPLSIRLYSSNGCIVMENSLQLKRAAQPSLKVGLNNISDRYRHFTSKPVSINTQNSLFTVTLPAIYAHSPH
jgi:two-component system LytT family sensor kinase